MRLIRNLFMTTFVCAGISAGHAADYLRGPISEPAYQQPVSRGSTTIDWSGFHFGLVGGWGKGKFNTGSSVQGAALANATFPNLAVTDQIGDLIRFNTPSSTGAYVGAFGGYSTQWDDVVVGIEAEYGRPKMEGGAQLVPIARRLSAAGHLWDVDLMDGGKQFKLTDFGVVRTRIGAAFGNFLPFMTFGVAVGRIETTTTLNGTLDEFELTPITDTNGNVIGYNRINYGSLNVNYRNKKASIRGGYAIGAGLDFALTSNVFLRGHWEYTSIGANKNVNIGMHQFKGGAAVKF